MLEIGVIGARINLFLIFRWHKLLKLVTHTDQLIVGFLVDFVILIVRSETAIVFDQQSERFDRILSLNAFFAETGEEVNHSVVLLKFLRVDVGIKLHQKGKFVLAFVTPLRWQVLGI